MPQKKPATLLPWDDLMRLGLGHLKLPPKQFWSMTPRELKAASDAIMGQGVLPPKRRDLATMMQRFPDKNNPTDESFKNERSRQ